jgi:hypothetical protein
MTAAKNEQKSAANGAVVAGDVKLLSDRSYPGSTSKLNNGQLLTGKQEHCAFPLYRRMIIMSIANILQISSVSSFPNKSPGKSTSLVHQPHFNDLEHPFALNLEKYLLLTLICQLCAISLCIMCETSHSWTRRKRRSFGRTSCKW